jgi:hypothetical protein
LVVFKVLEQVLGISTRFRSSVRYALSTSYHGHGRPPPPNRPHTQGCLPTPMETQQPLRAKLRPKRHCLQGGRDTKRPHRCSSKGGQGFHPGTSPTTSGMAPNGAPNVEDDTGGHRHQKLSRGATPTCCTKRATCPAVTN